MTRRNMELAAAYDLLVVLRLIDAGRISVSTKTRRAAFTAQAAERRIPK